MSAEVMNPKELGKYLGIHLVTVYRHIKSGKIPGTRIGGQWRFKKTVIDEMFRNRKAEA